VPRWVVEHEYQQDTEIDADDMWVVDSGALLAGTLHDDGTPHSWLRIFAPGTWTSVHRGDES